MALTYYGHFRGHIECSVWFPTHQGAAVIYPRSVPINNQPPPVVIESCLLDVAILDIDMPVMWALNVGREVRNLGLPVGIIFLTVHSEGDMFNEAFDLGALG